MSTWMSVDEAPIVFQRSAADNWKSVKVWINLPAVYILVLSSRITDLYHGLVLHPYLFSLTSKIGLPYTTSEIRVVSVCLEEWGLAGKSILILYSELGSLHFRCQSGNPISKPNARPIPIPKPIQNSHKCVSRSELMSHPQDIPLNDYVIDPREEDDPIPSLLTSKTKGAVVAKKKSVLPRPLLECNPVSNDPLSCILLNAMLLTRTPIHGMKEESDPSIPALDSGSSGSQ
eukprot:Gb_21228 [translate_table: standard]